jgi:hypothetical protein
MDWIKKNYDRFILALFAVVLIGVAVMLFLTAQKFGERFSEVMASPIKSTQIKEVDTARISQAKKDFEAPVKWQSGVHSGLLFTSERYVVKEGGRLEKIGQGFLEHSRTKERIPESWLIQYALSPIDPTVGVQDPDGDGFLTEDEAVAKPPTDPTKKDSHPPYYTQLFLKSWITNPFQWQFMEYNGDPKTPDNMTFQVNPMHLKGPSEFLPIGSEIPRTGFKIKSFKFKEVENKSTGGMDNVSEVTIANPETGEELILPLHTIIKSGQTGNFEYRWNKKATEQGQLLSVAKGKDINNLAPEPNVKYKLLDGNQDNAVIQLPDGQKYTVPLLTK